jgi:hypothetical protein
VRFGLEVHPTEIAYDFVTTKRALDAIGNREGFGINFDPSHFAHQFLDSAAFIEEFADRIYHFHIKDSRKRLDGRRSILGSHLDFGEAAAAGTSSPGARRRGPRGCVRALNRIGYGGPLSIEWEDSGMDREYGAQDALAFARRTDFAPSTQAFDAAFARGSNGRDRRGPRRLQVHGPRPLQRLPPAPPLLRRRPRPRMAAICGRDEAGVREAADSLGWQSYETDYRRLIERTTWASWTW